MVVEGERQADRQQRAGHRLDIKKLGGVLAGAGDDQELAGVMIRGEDDGGVAAAGMLEAGGLPAVAAVDGGGSADDGDKLRGAVGGVDLVEGGPVGGSGQVGGG
ncbi:MAG: hypothetical protein AAF532_02290, partial [Planctomycetota bacterium]